MYAERPKALACGCLMVPLRQEPHIMMLSWLEHMLSDSTWSFASVLDAAATPCIPESLAGMIVADSAVDSSDLSPVSAVTPLDPASVAPVLTVHRHIRPPFGPFVP